MTIFTEYPNAELLRGIDGISSLRDQLEETVYSLMACQADPGTAVDTVKQLEAAVSRLRSDLIRQYFERRILEASLAFESIHEMVYTHRN